MTEENPRIQKLKALRAESKLGGGQDRIDKHHAKGSLTARERIDLLVDKGSFREIGALSTGLNDPKARNYGDGVVTGYGQSTGVPFMSMPRISPLTAVSGQYSCPKDLPGNGPRRETGSPIIGMIDSGGARIQEGVYSLGGYAEIFRRNAIYSGVVPQISLIMGPCAGGASYSPAVTDLIIMVRKQSTCS